MVTHLWNLWPLEHLQWKLDLQMMALCALLQHSKNASATVHARNGILSSRRVSKKHRTGRKFFFLVLNCRQFFFSHKKNPVTHFGKKIVWLKNGSRWFSKITFCSVLFFASWNFKLCRSCFSWKSIFSDSWIEKKV